MSKKPPELLNDCFVHDKDRLRHDEALEILKSRMVSVAGTETVALDRALDRICAADVLAPRPIPAFDNSAVDGYAFAEQHYAGTGGYFPVITRIAAGDQNEVELPANSAARIFTGARMPIGADTVAMQEDCEPHDQDGAFVAIPPGLKRGANCRLAGEDVGEGDIVVAAATRLRAQELAAIASSGIDQATVFKKLKVAVISTGNELLPPGAPFEAGCVYDANSPMLGALLARLPLDVTRLAALEDTRPSVIDALEKAAGSHDVIISTGGASKGEEDHLTEALGKLGKRHMWQLAIKPGRPMCFGQIGSTPVFVLPGNPVAAFVCFLLYVRPCLQVLCGGTWEKPLRYPLPANFEIKRKKPDRREFLRGTVKMDASGEASVTKFSRDGSGLITSLQQSNCLIEISEETETLNRGEPVQVIPFSQFGI